MLTHNGHLAIAYGNAFPVSDLAPYLGKMTNCSGEKVETVLSQNKELKTDGYSLSRGYGIGSLLEKLVKKSKSTIASLSTKTTVPPFGVFFSNGTAAGYTSDFRIAGDTFLTTYEATIAVQTSIGNDCLEKTVIYTITNSGTESFTIGEVGLLGYTNNYDKSSYTNFYNSYLFDRTFLETPVTIAGNGGIGQVTYTIRMNYPTA